MKIADFGISSQLDSTHGMCSTFVGTTCYMVRWVRVRVRVRVRCSTFVGTTCYIALERLEP